MKMHEWVGKVIYWEFCKRLNFAYANKCCKYKTESVPENERHKILWDFEIQINYYILARRQDLILINKIIIYLT